jgi:hypothetical protein
MNTFPEEQVILSPHSTDPSHPQPLIPQVTPAQQLFVPAQLPPHPSWQVLPIQVSSAQSQFGIHMQALFTQMFGDAQGRVPVLETVSPQLVTTFLVPQKVFNAGVYEDTVHPHAFATPPPPHVLGRVQGRVPSLDISPQFVDTIFVPQKVFNAGLYQEIVHPHSFATPPPPHVLGRVQVIGEQLWKFPVPYNVPFLQVLTV